MLAVIVLGPWLLSPITHHPAQPLPFAHITSTAWIALAISGLLCTATTTLLWNWGIHHVPASRAGVFLNIEPALGSYLGVRLLGEHLDLTHGPEAHSFLPPPSPLPHAITMQVPPSFWNN